jgi:N-acyl-D-aspartate/D-glutamate deacylase
VTYDLIVRNGTVVDGSGLPGYRADIGISGGMIAEIGDLRGQAAKQTIDAEGHTVAPGFIDGHTHMDAQIFWDPIGTNSCWHGVTSVIMGNCGFSLAPCAEKDKALVLRNLERAEDIPRAAMEAGIPWSWETIPEYLDTVDRLPKGINYATYIGHSALRTYVMGERAFTESANEDDMKALKGQLAGGIRAGAVGFSTSRSENHRTPEGKPVASRLANWQEVGDLIRVMADLGTGVFELSRGVIGADDETRRAELQTMKSLAIETKVPFTFGGNWYNRRTPDVWRTQFGMVDEVNAAGGKMLVQATSAWNGSLRSFETVMPFDRAPIWGEFRKLPLEQQEAGLRNPDMRRRLVEAAQGHRRETDLSLTNTLLQQVDWDWLFPLTGSLPPYPSVGDIARQRGKDPLETAIDLALERHLKLFFVSPFFNEDDDYVLTSMRHPASAVTFTDSGAHVASTMNPAQTHLLAHWVRDRQAMSLEMAIRKITLDIAAFWGLRKRGFLARGHHADLAIFDLKSMDPGMPTLVRDLPTGAPRLVQKATGFLATVVNGEVLTCKNEHTGALPGRLLRGPLAGKN